MLYSTIKTRRAKKLARTGRFPRTWSAILDRVPATLVAGITAAQLAAVVDAMYTQHELGHSAGYRYATA